MKKLGNKGFVLAETLVVAAFVAVIFSVMYSNFYPLMGEYEKRESYDDVDSKYAIYWIKKIIEHDSTDKSNWDAAFKSSQAYYNFTCEDVHDRQIYDMCISLVSGNYEKDGRLQVDYHIPQFSSQRIPHVYITRYSLAPKSENGIYYPGFKNGVKYYGTDLSGRMMEYVEYLPEYSNTPSLNDAQYRVFVEFKKDKEVVDEDVSYYAYSTIEVVK